MAFASETIHEICIEIDSRPNKDGNMEMVEFRVKKHYADLPQLVGRFMQGYVPVPMDLVASSDLMRPSSESGTLIKVSGTRS